MKTNSVDLQLIKILKSRCEKNISLIDEVANILNINYDAAYRRINGKTSLSLEDAIKLSRHYSISLNGLFNNGLEDQIVVTKTKEINNAADLEKYFHGITRDLIELKKHSNGSIFYSAKDLPIFYVLQNNLLFRFKIYVWLYILDKDVSSKNIQFENFKFSKNLIEAGLEAGEAYNNVNITEMWNYGIISSLINQITYFFEINLLSYTSALKICEDLKKTIKQIEESANTGTRQDVNKTEFRLYHNELLLLNNNIIIKWDNQKTLISPYSLLRYYKIKDVDTCNTVDEFFNNQIRISKLLSKTGVKERLLFFKPKYNKIDKLIKHIELLRQFPIMAR